MSGPLPIFPERPGLGWRPDTVDVRDYTLKHDEVYPLKAVKVVDACDWRRLDTPIMNQGSLGSCTANACAGVAQFLENANYGAYVPLSRLYLYKATRYLMGIGEGDSGASLRATAQALTMIGAPPEMYWPYDIRKFDDDPTWLNRPESGWFLSGLADCFEGTRYVRLDPDGAQVDKVMDDIRTVLASCMPVKFGTTVWDSIFDVGSDGNIPWPDTSKQPAGGHAIMALGFDNSRVNVGTSEKGAFLIRNSWGTEWGMAGYGWLPYKYFYDGYACDFWTFQNMRWVNTGDFA